MSTQALEVGDLATRIPPDNNTLSEGTLTLYPSGDFFLEVGGRDKIKLGHVDLATGHAAFDLRAFSRYLSEPRRGYLILNNEIPSPTENNMRDYLSSLPWAALKMMPSSVVARLHPDYVGIRTFPQLEERIRVLAAVDALPEKERALLSDPDAKTVSTVSELLSLVLPALERHDITITNKTGDAAKVYDAPNQKLMDRYRSQLPDGTQVTVTVHKLGSNEQVSGEATIKNGQLELSESLKQKMTDYDISSNYQTADMQQVYMDRLTGKLAKKDGTDFAKGTKILLMTQTEKTKGVVVGVNGKPLAQAGATNPTPVALDEASIHNEVEAWNKKNPENLRHADQEITQAKLESSSVFRVHNPVTHTETLVNANLIPLTQVKIKNDPVEIVLCAQMSGTQVQVLMNNKGEALNFDTFDVQPDSLVVKTYSPTPPHPTAWVVVRSDKRLLDPASFQPLMPELKLVDVSVSGIDHEYLVIKNDNEALEPSTMKPSLPKTTLTGAIGLDGTERNFLSTSTQELLQLTRQSPKARLVQVAAAIPHNNLPIMVTAGLQFHP